MGDCMRAGMHAELNCLPVLSINFEKSDTNQGCRTKLRDVPLPAMVWESRWENFLCVAPK
jgi:hypothetical protein